MKNKIILFALILSFIMMLSVVSATDISDNASYVDEESYISENVDAATIQSEDLTYEKELKKDYNSDTKTATNNVNVNSYKELVKQVEQAKNSNQETYTINLQSGNYQVTQPISWGSNNQKTKKLIINGNNNELFTEEQKDECAIELKKGFTLELNNIQFNSFTQYVDETAAINTEGTLIINNCKFKNNNGLTGSIFACGSNVTIKNSDFDSCTTENGVISINDYSNLTVTNSNFSYCNGYTGGVFYIRSHSNAHISNCEFQNNAAVAGGSTYLGSASKMTISNSNFVFNSAEEGGVIYADDSKLDIINSTFLANTVDGNGAVVYADMADVSIVNSEFSDNHAYESWENQGYGGAIYSLSSNLTITDSKLSNNTGIFDDAIVYRDYYFNNNIVVNNISLNTGLIFDVPTTDEFINSFELCKKLKGFKTVKIILQKPMWEEMYIKEPLIWGNCKGDVKELIIEGGWNIVYGNHTNYFMKVYEGYTLTLNNITINGFKSKYGGALAIWKGTVNLNNCNFINNVATRGGAIYNYYGHLTCNNTTFSDNKASQKGQDIYEIKNVEAKLTLNPIHDIVYRDTINITGKLANTEGVAFSNCKVYVNLNGVKKQLITDKTGLFTISMEATKAGLNTLKVDYKGNSKYNATSLTQTFNVTKAPTVINVDNIKTAVYRDNVTVTGIVSNVKGITFSNAKIFVYLNGVKKQVTTDKNGKFKVSFVVKQAGMNTIKVTYAGNSRYNATTIEKTFNSNKRPTVIELNQISSVKVNENIIITGRITDKSNNSFNHLNMFVTVNGKENRVLTENGIFTYTIPAKIKGVNNITVSYKGNANYESSIVKATVKVI